MTSSNGNIFRVTGPLCGEFTSPGEFPTQRPVTWSFDIFFDLHLNIHLSKQPWGWWFETPSWSLWSQCNGSNHNKPGSIYHREDKKVRISICHERIDANLTVASIGICNELVQCKIYKKSAIFSWIFSLVHSTRKVFCIEIIGTPPECGIPLGNRQVNIRTNSWCRCSLQR